MKGSEYHLASTAKDKPELKHMLIADCFEIQIFGAHHFASQEKASS
jgi:hypothetical protein